MSIGGWIIMLTMWIAVIGVATFCFARVLMEKPEPGGGKEE